MIKSFMFVVREHPCGVPYNKNDAWDFVTGGASLIGSLLGFESQRETNQQQIELSREQMQHQSSENQISRDWSEKMWNLQNQYNTPSAMMQRYSEAGLNPYLVGSDSGVGSAGSPVSSSSTGQGSVPSLVAPKLDLATPVSLALQSKSVDANVANQRSQALRTAVDAVADAYYRLGKPAASKIADLILPSVAGHESPETSAFMLQALQERKSLELQNEAQTLTNKLRGLYSETEIKTNLQEQNYRVSEIVARLNTMRVSNDAVIQKMANDTLVAAAQAWKLRKEGDYYVANKATIDAIRSSLVSQIESESIIVGNRAKLSSFESDIILSPENQEKKRTAYGIDLDIESDRTHRYIREIEEGIGNVIHVGVGSYDYSGTYRGTYNNIPHNSKTATFDSTTPWGTKQKNTWINYE